MARVADYLALIDNPSAVWNHPPDALDGPLVELMIFLAYSDGVLHNDELALIGRMRPDIPKDALLQWVEEQSDITMDLVDLASRLPDPKHRWGALRLAARLVCMDGEIAHQEQALLGQLAKAFALDESSVRRAVAEVVAPGGDVSTERLMSSLRNMLWRNASPTRDEPEGALRGKAPIAAEHVVTILLGDVEVAALYEEGLLAAFESGVHFVHWSSITSYTRVPVPGAMFHVRTAEAHLKMADPRMRDIGALLDFVFGRERLPEA